MLSGPYEPNETIQLYYTPTSASAQGKEAKVLTVTRSYEQPTASNGSRSTTLTTTIEDIFNGIYDVTHILSMNTSLFDNSSFTTHVGGGNEWNYSEGGKRTMNVREITREVDLSAGSYGANITAEELQAMKDRTALLGQGFWNRGTNLNILNVNISESANYQNSAGNVNIFFDRTEEQPGNSHAQKSTSRSRTYDFGIGFVPNATPIFLGQFTEETLQAEAWIYDDTGGVTGVYNHDSEGNPSLVREDDIVVLFTYVGGKAPQ